MTKRRRRILQIGRSVNQPANACNKRVSSLLRRMRRLGRWGQRIYCVVEGGWRSDNDKLFIRGTARDWAGADRSGAMLNWRRWHTGALWAARPLWAPTSHCLYTVNYLWPLVSRSHIKYCLDAFRTSLDFLAIREWCMSLGRSYDDIAQKLCQ